MMGRRRFLAHLVLALIVAWPGLHILLARRFGFSTWRYGGWGMYATPERRPPLVGLVAIVSPHDREGGEVADFDELARIHAVDHQTLITHELEARQGLVVVGTGLDPGGAALRYLHPLLLVDQGRHLRRVYALGDRASMVALVDLWDQLLVGGPSPRSWYLTAVERRLDVDPGGGWSERWAELWVFRVTDGQAVALGAP